MKKREKRVFQPFVLRPFYYIHSVVCDVFVDPFMVPTFVLKERWVFLEPLEEKVGRGVCNYKKWRRGLSMVSLTHTCNLGSSHLKQLKLSIYLNGYARKIRIFNQGDSFL